MLVTRTARFLAVTLFSLYVLQNAVIYAATKLFPRPVRVTVRIGAPIPTAGLTLDDRDALEVLGAWNARCQPPWSDRELTDKIRRARKYGREPLGGMIGSNTLIDASARMSY